MDNSKSISVTKYNGILVVDSRLIALELGIKHKNFLSTLDKYLEELEADWGAVAFETREFKTSQGNVSSERFALLTEPQATLLMTYSRNTEKVRNCKRQLVKAFEKAKSVNNANYGYRILELEEKLAAQSEAIALLQSQVQNLLPASTNYIPPGWDKEVWNELPTQDKRHFRFLYRRRGFRPNYQVQESKSIETLTQQIKQQQHSELKNAVGEVSTQEKEKLEAAKQKAKRQLQIGEDND